MDQDPDWLPDRGSLKKARPWKIVLISKMPRFFKNNLDFGSLFVTMTLGRYSTKNAVIKALQSWKTKRGSSGELWGPSNYNVTVTFKGKPQENFLLENGIQ